MDWFDELHLNAIQGFERFQVIMGGRYPPTFNFFWLFAWGHPPINLGGIEQSITQWGDHLPLGTAPILEKLGQDLRVAFRSADDRKNRIRGPVEMTGVFTILNDSSEEKQMEIVAVNAPSILYSSVRDFVAMLTAHGPNGKLVLPSVSFIDQKLLPQSKSVQPASKAEPASR